MRKTALALSLFAGLVMGQMPAAVEKVNTAQVLATVNTLQPHVPVTAKNGHATNRVFVYMDDGSMSRKPVNGAAEQVSFKRGDVQWRPASGALTVENTSGAPIRILEIDLKGKQSGPAPVSKLDPVVVDAKHYKVEFENDQVRVLRIHYGPHEQSPEHEHILNRVVLFLNEQRGGKLDEVHLSGAVKHVEKNDLDTGVDRIAVELK
jgi:hypothetical protein